MIYILAFILGLIILIGANLISYKKECYKITPFECGINPRSSQRVPFSLQFAFIALLFLLFDIEIVIILPIPIMKFSQLNVIVIIFIIIIILLLGLAYEWGKLKWDYTTNKTHILNRGPNIYVYNFKYNLYENKYLDNLIQFPLIYH